MSQQITKRPRRVQLAVPGSSPKMLAKAAGSKADHVFLDLEDAVAPSKKIEARDLIIDALTTLDWTGKTRCVRINDLSTQYAHDDIIHIVEHAGDFVDTFMIPKVRDAADIRFVDILLTQLELKLGLKRRIGIEALIEEVEGLQNIDTICRASSRLEAVIFGMGDYSASQGMNLSQIGDVSGYPGDIWHYPRFQIVMAARAAGIDAVDGPYADFRNLEGYEVECRRSEMLGCVGKWAIHPAQIDVALEVFSPTPEQVAKARAVTKAYFGAEAQGHGAVQVDGVMIDAASVRMVKGTLDKAELYGL